MGSRVFLTNLNSDVSGYKLALVDMRNPNLQTTVPTATTNATSSGSNIQMTATAGGTALKWITRKMSTAVTLGAVVGESAFVNVSANESAASVNAGLQLRLLSYSGTTETAALTDNYGTELATTTLPNMWATTIGSNWTANPALAVGDRLVIKMYVNNVGTMAAGSVIMSYDGAAGGAGDTYVEFLEILQVSQAQIGSATTPGVTAKGVSYFVGELAYLNGADPGSTSGGWASDDMTVLALKNECQAQANLE
jgi:hypothetical protein